MDIKMIRKECIIQLCTNVFKVSENCKQVTCSDYCRDESLVRKSDGKRFALGKFIDLKIHNKSVVKKRATESRRLNKLFGN